MEKEKATERDARGDIKFKTGKIDWQKIRSSQYTYVFRYFDEQKRYFFPSFGLFSTSDERLEKAKEDIEFFELKLYQMPDEPPYDFFLWYHNNQLGMLVEFFKEVFEERAFLEGYQPNHKYFKIILPKSVYNEIINFINEFELLPIRDLLFEVIAIAQHKYVENIAHWEQPRMQKLVDTAAQETQHAIQVIEKLESKDWEQGKPGAKPPSELQYINFVFNDESIRVGHEWLAGEFVDHFKNYYNDLHFKDWKKDLARYPDRFEDNIKNQQFKYKLAKSFYNLLTKTGAYKLEKSKLTPNRLMLCISKLIEFCLISVGKPGEIDSIKAKNVRNWISRKDLEPALTEAEIKADKQRLLKYFEPDFINITDDIIPVDAISIGVFLAKRFDMMHLLDDLIYLARALREYGSYIGHQMIGTGRYLEPNFPEYKSFSQLINGIKSGGKIGSFKFTMEGDDTEHELIQRLPAHLLEQALKEYLEGHQVEFDTEPVATKVTRPEPGSFKIEKGNEFIQPEERFMVRFVKSFYDYLLNEAPSTEGDFMPSVKYYSLIANMLQQTWFFYHQRHPEWFVIEKVKQWHKMSGM